ncbi:MAG: glycosyltransferase [Ardenticatenales bacterium]|nr:glycosyltransferase [Ardenticatenales bacterium]
MGAIASSNHLPPDAEGRHSAASHPGPAASTDPRCAAVLHAPPRIAMLSVHTCPLAAPGGKQTGGMNVYVRELMRQLGRRGFLVDAFTRSESALIPHVPDTDLGPNVRVIHIVSGPETPVTRDEIWANVPSFIEGVCRFVAAEGVRYDLYHSHYWMSGHVAAELRRCHPAPIVHMFHTLGAMKDLAAGGGASTENIDRIPTERAIMGYADALVAATSIDMEHMVELYGADPSKIEIIPPGVDLDVFRPMPREQALAHLQRDPCERMILFVGRMDPIKGLDTLIRAMGIVVARDPSLRENACLCVVGGDTSEDLRRADAELGRLNDLAESLGLGHLVRFIGALGQDALRYYYNAAEVVVVPSRYESFGMVALEAMACGTPVIASDVGGLSTLIRDGRTGFLVPDGDPEALAAKLQPLLALPEIHDTLGEHGIATAEAYGWPAIAERVEALYGQVWRDWHVRVLGEVTVAGGGVG